MAGDLTLQRKSAGDLRLPISRSGDLVLRQPSPGDLVLHYAGNPQARLQATMPPPVSLLQAQAEDPGIPARLQAQMPPPQSLMRAGYDNAVWRGVAQANCAAWDRANGAGQGICANHGETGHLRRELCNTVNDGRSLNADLCAPFLQSATERRELCAPHQSGQSADTALCAPWVQLTPMRRPQCQPWQEGERASPAPVCQGWVDLLRTARPGICASIISARAAPLSRCGDYRDALRTRHHYCWSWQEGVLRTGWGGQIIIPPQPPHPPEQPCAAPLPAELVLVPNRDASTLILRPCIPGPQPPGPIVVPIRRVYVMSNNASLIRVSDGTEIPVLKLTAAIDARSWAWSLSAEVPLSAQSSVENDGSGPVELEATINGHSWRFLAENLRRNRAFGSKSLSVSGRGIAAALDAPFAIEQTFSNSSTGRTAVQLMEDALTINGVPMGWTVDATAITDWLVTAGAWNHYGTHISAINAIAGSIDALVQAHQTDKTLLIQPRYPVLPWKWATDVTPDIILPEDVIVQEGLEWLDKPGYNGVYVSGQNQGVLGQIKITGTAGDAQAPMVTNPLITHADAARQRGEAILGDTGRQQRLTLSMPIGGDTTLPVILPNQFIEYGPQSTIGLVRGVRVDASRPQYRQFVDVEVHL